MMETSVEEEIRELERRLEVLRRKQQCEREGEEGEKVWDGGEGLPYPAELERRALSNQRIPRYGRQLILPGFGVTAQRKLSESRVVIIGAGGLGCPCALYLTGAGVGTIGIVDGDTVDVSNLHRQVIHTEGMEGRSKCHSAAATLRRYSSDVRLHLYPVKLSVGNALDILRPYDLVLDCTDNPGSRYLINDAAVLLGKPLISAAAIGFEGQLSVYNYDGGPCYRCVFPHPPSNPPSCSDNGVLGVVPGILGTMQAVEAIKLLALVGEVHASKLLLYDSLYAEFRSVRLNGRHTGCAVCGDSPTITDLVGSNYGATREEGCAVVITDLPAKHRLSCRELHERLTRGGAGIVLDVRNRTQFAICHLPGSRNVPLKEMTPSSTAELLRTVGDKSIYVVCRRGNDSQRATLALLRHGVVADIYNIEGGLQSWSRTVDPSFPTY